MRIGILEIVLLVILAVVLVIVITVVIVRLAASSSRRAGVNQPAMPGTVKLCPNCGHQLKEGPNFCPVCGTAIKPSEAQVFSGSPSLVQNPSEPGTGILLKTTGVLLLVVGVLGLAFIIYNWLAAAMWSPLIGDISGLPFVVGALVALALVGLGAFIMAKK